MVYVDQLAYYGPKDWWCHMVADSHDELMAMARKLRLQPEWIQHPGKPTEHFDLRPSKRAQALTFGAKAIDRRAFSEVVYGRRKERGMPELIQELTEESVYWMVCPICDAGLDPDTTYQTFCDVCRGTGYIEVREETADGAH